MTRLSWTRMPEPPFGYERIPDDPETGRRRLRCTLDDVELSSFGVGYHASSKRHRQAIVDREAT